MVARKYMCNDWPGSKPLEIKKLERWLVDIKEMERRGKGKDLRCSPALHAEVWYDV